MKQLSNRLKHFKEIFNNYIVNQLIIFFFNMNEKSTIVEMLKDKFGGPSIFFNNISQIFKDDYQIQLRIM